MNSNEEKLLREFVRKTFVSKVLQEQKRVMLQEQKIRGFVRSMISEVITEDRNTVINESRDVANPHPNTGINKLRDAIRKSKVSIKSKYQQLTSSPEQRESFTNHFLAAFVRMFDQADALSASADEAEVEAVDSELGLPNEDSSLEGDKLQAPPEDEMDDIEDDIESLLESIINELDIELNEEEEELKNNDIISNDIEKEKETEKNKNLSQVEKDFQKKKNQEKEREEFGSGIEGDSTGRNQAFDAFNLVQSYFLDNYFDLDNDEDKEMFKKWGLYNLKLLLDSFEEEVNTQIEQPNIENPQ